MSGTNDFKPFAVGAGANVLTQADYLALASLGTGFESGVAQSAALNKVWRQASIMASVLAQMIVDNTGQNATDDGTTATLLANLHQAISGRLIQVQIFNSSGTYNPTPGTNSIIVEAQGGGGGGGGVAATGSSQFSIGGGGQSGAYAKSRFTSGFSGGVTVTVGAAGTAGAAGNNQGGTGGNTSFGSLIAVGGGIGGLGGAATAAGSILFQQTPGGQTVLTPTGNIFTKSQSVISFGWGNGQGSFVAASGNDSPLGTGGRGAIGATGAGGGAIGNGAGGGGAGAGASAAAQAGGAGGGGCIIVWEYA